MKGPFLGTCPESVEGDSPGGFRAGTFAEREWKFVVEAARAEAFLRDVVPFTEPVVHDARRPCAYTRTTYLDTADFAYLRAASSGGLAMKIRVRQYAYAESPDRDPRLGSDCWLELKESEGGTRRKLRVRGAPSVIDALVERAGEASLDAAPDPALDEIRAVLRRDAPRPYLTTFYRREAREAAGVRISMDADLLFARAVPIGEPDTLAVPRDPLARFPWRIVEVKLAGAPPAWLVAAMTGLPAPADFSKFREGMSFLHVPATTR